jgi:hypothetical protein
VAIGEADGKSKDSSGRPGGNTAPLDAQGNLLWMKAGELNETEITAQLGKFGR